MNKGRIFGQLCGVALAILLLWLALRGVSAEMLVFHLRQVSPIGLGLAFGLLVVSIVLRAWRWQVLLSPGGRRLPFGSMFDAIMLGFMTTIVVPGRLGELVAAAREVKSLGGASQVARPKTEG